MSLLESKNHWHLIKDVMQYAQNNWDTDLSTKDEYYDSKLNSYPLG